MTSNPLRDPERRHDRLDEDGFHLFALDSMVAQLRSESAYQVNGHAGVTLLKNDNLSVVLEAARKDSRLGEHVIQGPSFVHVLEGSLCLECGDETRIAHVGEMAVVPQDRPRDVRAQEDSAFLLVLSLDGSQK